MERVRTDIQINGRKVWTLFDTGARNSYVSPAAAKGLPTSDLREPFRVALGGEHRSLSRQCVVDARVGGKAVSFLAYLLDSIGKDEEGREIDVLFGAIEMQRWGIRPVPDEERLDLTHYPEQFVEYWCPESEVR